MSGFEIAGTVLAEALAFAAGVMLYVVVDELVPESHGPRPRTSRLAPGPRRLRADDRARQRLRLS